MRKYTIETFGCQMNYHDSERLAGLLEAAGYEPASSDSDADVIVLNTCSVRERAEEKVYSRVGEIRHDGLETGHRPMIAVTGCVAQQEGAKLLKRAPSIDAIVGTQSLTSLTSLLDAAREAKRPKLDIDPHQDVSFPLGLVRHSDPARGYVTIIEGCNEFCSFCVVPYTRGHERMRPVVDILQEVERIAATGRREVQLLGQIVNHYQAPDDPSCDFASLLERVHAIPGITRIRFASPHPRHVTPRLIQVLRDLPKLCKHLHMPVQSGSNRILTAMRRRYSREEYLALATELRTSVPGVALSTDVIVGFPGETSEDFDETMDLVRTVSFQAMYSFKYSVRPNTLASKRLPDDVPEVEKTRRIMALQALQARQQLDWHQSLVGTSQAVLVDAVSRRRDWQLAGRTGANTVVNFTGSADLIGHEVQVRIVEAAPNSLRGELLAADPQNT